METQIYWVVFLLLYFILGKDIQLAFDVNRKFYL